MDLALSAPKEEAGFVRLHISPFNASLYDRIISASLRPITQNVSFHAVQTCPELGFGYVELPAMEAAKLKKKLQGSTLKGSKVRIEDAKPEKKRKVETVDGDNDEDERAARKRTKRAKKEKADTQNGVIAGHELEDGRHIKRGWIDGPGAKRSKVISKTSSKDNASPADVLKDKKMRFKTSVPPNVTPIDTSAKVKKAKKTKKGKGETVVQEFTKTRKPYTVASGSVPQDKAAVAYEDGKGWVDEEGNVVEPERVSKRPVRTTRKPEVESDLKAGESEKQHEAVQQTELLQANTQREDDKLSDIEDGDDAADSASSRSDSPAEESEESTQEDETMAAHNDSNDDHESEGEKEDGTPKAIHPLEALYKRSVPEGKLQLPPINTSFSFFGATDQDNDEESGGGKAVHQPQTPHTKQDLEWRTQRSAAPTPDTAAIGKRFSFPFGPDDDVEEEGEDEISPLAAQVDGTGEPARAGEQKEESAFRKFFYEQRGDANRAWKKRRREMKKQQRQRENRRLSRKVA